MSQLASQCRWQLMLNRTASLQNNILNLARLWKQAWWSPWSICPLVYVSGWLEYMRKRKTEVMFTDRKNRLAQWGRLNFYLEFGNFLQAIVELNRYKSNCFEGIWKHIFGLSTERKQCMSQHTCWMLSDSCLVILVTLQNIFFAQILAEIIKSHVS